MECDLRKAVKRGGGEWEGEGEKEGNRSDGWEGGME